MILFYKLSSSLMLLFLLSIVISIANLRLDRHNRLNQLFLRTCYMVLAALCMEMLAVILSSRPRYCANYILRSLFVFLFSVPPFFAFYWMMFSRVLTGDDAAKLGFTRNIRLVPAFGNVLLSILSFPFGLLFEIDRTNAFHSGPLWFVTAGITLCYLVFGFAVLVHRRKRLRRDDFRILAVVCLMPVLGGGVQLLLGCGLFLWDFAASALIVMYVCLQERMIQIDGLTGAWTRFSFYRSLNHLTESHRADHQYGVLFLDIDDFKQINDKYGHAEGDQALKTFTSLVQSCLRENDIIARLGGDEFAILASVGGMEDLQKMIRRIHATLEVHNRLSDSLRCSIGAELYEAACSADAILENVDKQMYEQKRAKKSPVSRTDKSGTRDHLKKEQEQ